MIAGLGTPDDDTPWFLPVESDYVDRIKQV